MLRKADLGLAIEVLVAYETEFYPNSRAESDIRDGLFWDGTKDCFSMDFGMCLRGETDEVRIYKGPKDWRENRRDFDTEPKTVVYGNVLFFLEAVTD